MACGSKSDLHVHHRSYENFTREEDGDLRVLCALCHGFVHHLERTSNLSLGRATDRVIEAGAIHKQILPPAKTAAHKRAVKSKSSTPTFVKGAGKSSIDDFFAAERETRSVRLKEAGLDTFSNKRSSQILKERAKFYSKWIAGNAQELTLPLFPVST